MKKCFCTTPFYSRSTHLSTRTRSEICCQRLTFSFLSSFGSRTRTLALTTTRPFTLPGQAERSGLRAARGSPLESRCRPVWKVSSLGHRRAGAVDGFWRVYSEPAWCTGSCALSCSRPTEACSVEWSSSCASCHRGSTCDELWKTLYTFPLVWKVSATWQSKRRTKRILWQWHTATWAQLCGALIVLWKQFLEVVADQDRVRQQLARQRHLQRVKRFAEAYFVIERPRIAVLSANDASTQLFFEVTEALRRSEYLALLPPLEVECAELDGDSNNLPIIYEEHYQDFKTTPQGCASQSCLNLSDISLQFDDKRPSASAVSSMKLSERAAVASKLLGEKLAPLRHGSPTLSADADLGSPTSTSSTSSADTQDRDGATRSGKGSASSSRGKVKLKARTASLLRQLKRPHLNNSSVTLLAFKKLDAFRNRAVEAGGTASGSQMKHSQSSVAVTSANLSLPRTAATPSQSHLLNSESMPDLTTQLVAVPARTAPQAVPPAPPPPRSRVASDSLNANFDALFVSDPLVARKAVSESCSCVRPHLRTALAHSLTAAKYRRSTSSCHVGFDARRTSAPLSNAHDPRRGSLGIPDFRRESLGSFRFETGIPLHSGLEEGISRNSRLEERFVRRGLSLSRNRRLQ
ncbi:hypothetical protein MRX96_056460 [Rhipicephalus microplus]